MNIKYAAIALVIIIVAFFSLGYFKSTNQYKQTASPQVPPSPIAITLQEAIQSNLYTWSEPKTVQKNIGYYGALRGKEIHAIINSDKSYLDSLENKEYVIANGFEGDGNLAASGPGSVIYGYKKVENGQTQILQFSIKTTPTSSNPNEPLQFNCPCEVKLTAFLSEPF